MSNNWEGAGQNVAGDGRQALWRRCSDAGYLDLIRQHLERKDGVLLKTDAWDEASSDGLLLELKPYAEHILGMDISGSTLQRARKRHCDANFVQADARALPFKNSSIKTVVSNSTLDHFEHINELRSSLAELIRVLAPGGQLFITLDNPANPVIWLRNHLPLRWLQRLRIVPYYVGATLSARQLSAELKALGLDIRFGGYTVHAPRALMVAMAALLQRWASPRFQQWFVDLQKPFEQLAKWPTASLSGHYVVVFAVRKP